MDAWNLLYESLEQKVLRLMEQIRFLKQENERLKQLLSQNQETLQTMQQMLKKSEEEKKLLTTAALLVKTEQKDIQQANSRINSLVREIDECIALLTKE
ncbi:MAG: hypothetical protein N2449_00815 [Bacteroidales bacterium]|nr:hypothetical protein [Bacteroidales bacterium]